MLRAWRALLTDPTALVEAMLWWLALCWLVSLALTPDAAFVHAGALPLLQVKGLWVWPAVAAVALPPVAWLTRRQWRALAYALRLYKLAWWLFLALALLALAPPVPALWGPPVGAVAASIWLLARAPAVAHHPRAG